MKCFDPKRSSGAFNIRSPRLSTAPPLKQSPDLGFGLRALSLVTALLVFFQGPLAMGATSTWSGTTSGSWGDGAKWSPDPVPGAADSAVFTPVVGSPISIVLGGSLFEVKGLSIGASSADGASSITLGIQPQVGTLSVGTSGISFAQPNANKFRTLSLLSDVNLAGVQTWDVNGAGDSIVVDGVITGAASSSLTKIGAGSLTLSGTNTFAGSLNLTAGQLNLNSHSAAGTGVLTISGGSLDNTSTSAKILANSALVFNGDFVFGGSRPLNTGTGPVTLNAGTVTVLANVLTVGGTLGGSAGLTKDGAGTILINNAPATYAGSTVVRSGSLVTNNLGAIPALSAVEILSAGTLILGLAQTVASIKGSGRLDTAGLTITNGQNLQFSGALGGLGALTLSSGTLTLSGINTFGGITTVSTNAVLKISNPAALGATSGHTEVSTGGALDLNGQAGVAESIIINGAGIAGAGALLNSDTTNAVTLSGNVTLTSDSSIGGAGDLSVSGGLLGGQFARESSLTKTGAGVLTLGGSSGYTGATTVDQGTLRLAGAYALGSDASNRTERVSVSSGASLDLNGTTSAVSVDLVLNGTGAANSGALVNRGAAVVYGGAVSLAGSSAVTGGITLTGNISGNKTLSKVGAGNLVLEGLSNGASDILVTSGTLQIGGGGTSGALGSGSVSLSQGTDLVFNRSDTYGGNVGNKIIGGGSVTVASGTLRLSGQSTYTGVTTLLTGSTLVLGSSGALGLTQRLVVNGGGALDLNGNNAAAPLTLGSNGVNATFVNLSGSATYSGDILLDANGTFSAMGQITISGAISSNPSAQFPYALIKEGSNTLILTGTNSYGTTQIEAGTLQIGAGAAAGSLGIGPVVNNGALVFARSDTSTVSNLINGSGMLSIQSGTVALTGNNTYSGLSTVKGGAVLALGVGGASGMVGGSIALDSGSFVRFDRSDDIQYAGTLSGSGTLIKAGSNLLTLTGANNYGETQILAGTLQIGDNGVAGSLGSASVSNGGELVFARTDSITVANAISGAGAVSVNSGTVSLTGNNTYTGLTTVGNGAALLVGTGGMSGRLEGDTLLQSASTLRFNRSDAVLYGGSISGSGTFTKLGGGTLGLFGASSLMSGAVSVDAGVLAIGTGGATGALEGNILNNGAVLFNRTGSLVYGEVISGSGSVSSVGSGAITLSNNQTFYGATAVSAGSLTVQNLPNTSAIQVTGGSLSIVEFNSNADLSVTNTGRVDVSGPNLTLGGVITNDALTGGTLHFSANSGVLTLSRGLFGNGTTSFASSASIGGTLSGGSIFVSESLTASDIAGASVSAKNLTVSGTVGGGIISVANTAQLNVVSGGSLRLSASASVADLRGGTIELQGGAALLTIAGGRQAASGVISGPGGVSINGSLELAGANAYAGGTQLNAGILTIANGSALGAGSLTIADGAALDVSQPSIALSNAVTFGGSLSFLGSHALTLSGSVNLNAAASINVVDKTLVLGGSVDASGNTLTKLGGGALEFAGPASNLALTVSSGTVLARTGAFGSATTLVVAPAGRVALLGNQTIASGSISAQGALLLNASSLTLSADSLFAGTLQGETGSAVNIQNGVLTLSGSNNSFSGALNVLGGVLDLSATTQNAGAVRLNGGEIRNGTLGSSGLTLSNGTLNASLSGSALLVKDSTPGTVSLGGDNRAFAGSVLIEGGVLHLDVDKALTEAVAVSFNPGSGNATLSLVSDLSLRSLEGGGVVYGSQGIVDLSAGTLTLVSTGVATFGGSLKASSGAVLVVSGSGKQVLAGDSSQSVFKTVVKSGVLEITNAKALGSSASNLSLEGGTLALAANQPLEGPYDVDVKSESTITLAGAASQTLGILNLQGTLNVASAGPGSFAAVFGAAVLNGAATFHTGSLTAVTLDSLQGSHDFTKSGAGSLTLLGANNSTAGTSITGGSLLLGSQGALASGSLTLSGAATLLDLGNTSQTVGAVSVSSATVKSGTLNGTAFALSDAVIGASLMGAGSLSSSGDTILSGRNQYAGPTTVSAGSLTIASGGSLHSAGNLVVAAGATARFLGAEVTIGSISGLGSTLFSGTGSVSGNLSQGRIVFNGDANLASILGADVTVGGFARSGALGAGSLTLTGSGGIIHSVSGGSLHLAAAGQTVSVGTLTAGEIRLSGTLSAGGGTFAGKLAGSGTLALVSGGAMSLGGTLSQFSGAYAVDGTLNLTAATAETAALAVGGAGRVTLSLDGGTLGAVSNNGAISLAVGTFSIGSLSGSGVIRSDSSATLKVGQLGGAGAAGATFGGSLSGAISLIKQGAGALRLSGVSDFTGSTNVQGGSLIIASGQALSSGSIRVADRSSLFLDGQGNSLTLTNALSLTGSGTLLSAGGDNRVSGPITISDAANISVLSGTLFSTGSITGSASLSLTGNIDVGGAVTLGNGGTLRSLSGNIALRGGVQADTLVKSGSGRLTLGGTGAGAFTGSTFVSGGTLTLGGTAALAGDVTVNGGTLEFAAQKQLGGRLRLDSGFVALVENDEVSVGTFTASGGVLGKPGETATLIADVLDITGGTLNAVVLPSYTTTRYFSGTLTIGQIGTAGRSNPLEVGGTGAFITANTVYTTDLAIAGSNNTLSITGGGTSALLNAGTITIGGINNVLEFTQGFTPLGALVLTVGDATSTGGSLKVADPGLVLGGSQTLKGSGTVDGDVQLNSGATLAPGNSPGRLRITGSLAIGTGAATVLEYTAEKSVAVGTGAADKLEVGTLQSLGGNVSAYAVSGTFSGGAFNPTRVSRVNQVGTKSLPVVVYGSGAAPASLPAVTSYVTVGGPLAGGTYRSLVVTANLSAVQNQGLLQGGTVYLNVTRNPFASFAASRNAAATGRILDRDASLTSSNAAISNLIDLLDIQPTAAGIASTLTALDPGVYADLGNIGLDRLRDIQSGLANHIDMLALDSVGESSLSLAVKPGQSAASAALERARVWTTAYGGWGRRSSDLDGGSPGYNANHFGDLSGVETRVGSLTLGLFGAAGVANANFGNGRGKVDSDSWHTGIYGNFAAGPLVWDASLAYGQSQNKLRRSVDVPGGGPTTGRSEATEWTGQVGLAVPLRSESGSLMLTPSLRVLHAHVGQAGLQESPLNGLEAVVRRNNTASTSLRTGLQAAKVTKVARKQTRLTASLDWIQSLDSDTAHADITLAGSGAAPSRFQGSRTGSSGVRAGLGAEVATTERTRLRLNVDQQRRSGVNSTFGSISFSLQL